MTLEADIPTPRVEIKPVSERFPIVENHEKYFTDDGPELEEGRIVHYETHLDYKGTIRQRYTLQKTIAGLHYIFSLGEYRYYSMSFKTKEYEYATVHLDENVREELYKTIAGFIESVTVAHPEINTIEVTPADAPYSSEDIEACITEILARPDNEFQREELMEVYKGADIFDLYRRLFQKTYTQKKPHNWSKARARARLFKTIIKKYLPQWDVMPSVYKSEFIMKAKSSRVLPAAA